ncbi:MAG: leucine-rich repeat domain-containing protein [Muribaculaceae bacterium]|nr:leucine-rich repeat domain-containing protein [Muribaculaceae bacterium]
MLYMKKLTPQFRAIIIIALIITASLPAFAYDYKKNDIYYTIIDKEKKTIKVTNCYSDKKKIVIPNSIKINGVSYSVTEIDDEAFDYREKLKSVVIPNSVTKIGDRAFYKCTGLTSVTIGNSVTTIGDRAFYKCTGLTSVTIGNSVTTIGSHAFGECTGLTSVTIPNSVTTIGDWAFSGCSGLTSVTIPNSVTTLLHNSVTYKI